MSMSAVVTRYEPGVVFPTLLGVSALALLLGHDISARQALLLLIGTGLGVSLFQAAFGFSGGWRRFVRERRSSAIRAQLILAALVSLLFFPLLAGVMPGLTLHGAYAPVGTSVLLGAFLFGIGMQLGGGCGSGTLFTVGGGHVIMLITLAFFVVGSVIGSIHLPWWTQLPSLGRVSLLDTLGWPRALAVQLLILAVLYALVTGVERRRCGSCEALTRVPGQRPALQRLLFGPWPVLWGALALALLSLATLLVAGHPWSITFAFGLWGTKIWAALGGDISGWSYWNHGYPAAALGRSVLADPTSVMNMGIVLGATVAAGLAGRYAPADPIKARNIVSAVAGGLLLGYGARLAFGCNIGGLLAGLASGSLHGWLWLVSGFTGSLFGVYLRQRIGLDKATEHSA
jgi:uncharacterized membrane protein YedE/YeeE